MLAADYPFLDLFWSMMIFFLWIAWFFLLFTVWIDVFRRHDISGWGKAGWLIFTILLPFLGVFIYLISQGEGMTTRALDREQSQRARTDEYVRETAGGSNAAAEIEAGKQLLDSGAITQSEYDMLKHRALR
jgi:hypothetical protein